MIAPLTHRIATLQPAQLELILDALKGLGLGALAFFAYRRWRRTSREESVETATYIVGQRRRVADPDASGQGTRFANAGGDRGSRPTDAPNAAIINSHRRGVAIVLAVFLGSLGAHKFYLGRPVAGLLYAAFSWTMLPTLLSFAEAMIYLFQSDEQFAAIYGHGGNGPSQRIGADATRVVAGFTRLPGRFILVAAALLLPLYAYGTDWPPDEMVAADDVWIVVTASGWMVVGFVWWMVYGNGTTMLLRNRDAVRPQPTDYSKWRPPVDAPLSNTEVEPGQRAGEELPRV